MRKERDTDSRQTRGSTWSTRRNAEALNEVLHRLIKSTKATEIYRDDGTFTLMFLKLEFSFFPKDVVSESFLGWEEEGGGRGLIKG